jgi:hypothetical protein
VSTYVLELSDGRCAQVAAEDVRVTETGALIFAQTPMTDESLESILDQLGQPLLCELCRTPTPVRLRAALPG